MLKNWLFRINWIIGGMSVFLLLIAAFIFLLRPSGLLVSEPSILKRTLPRPPFASTPQAYEQIGTWGFDLQHVPMTVELPDLRTSLVYYGKNGRPDAQGSKPVMHFSFVGNSAPVSVISEEKHYIFYDRSKSPPQYVFSTQNAETPLWIEATCQGNEALVKVFMKDEQGKTVDAPASHASIRLIEKEQARISSKPWEMGKWRVDGSLLVRQKARWLGVDRFLERHGGEEFAFLSGKHRIDFTNEEEHFPVYVGANDSLIWKEEKWQVVKPGENTLEYPLMVVKKIDDRIMTFELWEAGGKNKTLLNLIRTSEMGMPHHYEQHFKFLGSRTRSQYIFEVEGQRMLISPKDWLLQTEEKWIKLATSNEIDDYVNGNLQGILFVCDGVVHEEGQQVLKGVLFNGSRTEMQEVTLAVQQGRPKAEADGTKLDEEDEEIEELDDDDDDDEIALLEKQLKELDRRKK